MWTLLNYLWTRKHDNIRQKQQQKLATSVGRERTNPIHRLHDQNCSPVSGFDVVADQCVINKGHLLSEQGCTVGWRDVKSSPICSPSCFFLWCGSIWVCSIELKTCWCLAASAHIAAHRCLFVFCLSHNDLDTESVLKAEMFLLNRLREILLTEFSSASVITPLTAMGKKKKHTLQICRQRSYLGHSHLWRKDPLGCSPRMAAWRISRACVTRVTVQRCQSVCVCVFLCIIPRVLQWITSVVHLKRSW